MEDMLEDTIYALATPAGGGIAVIRISGEKALWALEKCFSHRGDYISHKLYYGNVLSGRKVIDETMAVFMQSPRSYTGEDCAEIHCHGSYTIIKRILGLLSQIGLRQAEPGEFTKRAFLNGRISLSQAEAVMDLIHSSARDSAAQALDQLKGHLNSVVTQLQDRITDCIAQLEAQLDYPDEDLLDAKEMKSLERNMQAVKKEIAALIASGAQGVLMREGMKVVLAGKPNAGKSSLFNTLVGYSRAIVTDIAGTTRDLLEEKVDLCGLPVVLVDTAGLRENAQTVEKIGIERANQAMQTADLVIYVVDQSDLASEQEQANEFSMIVEADAKVVVFSKSDLVERVPDELANEHNVLRKKLTEINIECVESSAFDDGGVDRLKTVIVDFFGSKKSDASAGAMVTNRRHLDALANAREALNCAQGALEKNDIDCVTIDLRACWRSLGEITGETADEAVIERIFSKFCLGK